MSPARLPVFGRILAKALLLALLSPICSARAHDDTILYAFHGGTDAGRPFAGLIADKAGNLYGTTMFGGDYNFGGRGAVFEISASGVETVLFSFTKANGEWPRAALLADGAGNLYGTTEKGGHGCKGTCGTVFKLAPDGTETLLHSFAGGSDGAVPLAGLIADSAGNLYGTTAFGGIHNCRDSCGTVFRIAPDGAESIIYAFVGDGDGAYPYAGLLTDQVGNFYGTTSAGGANEQGTIFEIAPDGTETVLYSFCPVAGCADGAMPLAGLIADAAGNLYGTTKLGGAGFGTVFKLTPDGAETSLYAFKDKNDGEWPEAGLVRDGEGNLYGTTSAGSANQGAVFKISPDGREKTLHAFTGGSDGAGSYAGLLLGPGGILYGTTSEGGDPNCGSEGAGCGAVFEIHK